MPNDLKLPVEIWERVIDIRTEHGEKQWAPDVVADLASWSLVCRSWSHRCLYYLAPSTGMAITIASHDQLQAISKYLHHISYRAENIMQVTIIGGGPDQPWISTFPPLLPKLPNLLTLKFQEVDLRRQHPSFTMLLSRLKLSSKENIRLEISYNRNEDFGAQATQVAAVARAVTSPTEIYQWFSVQTVTDITRINSWPRRLTSIMKFALKGDPRSLAALLPGCYFPARQITVELRYSSFREEFIDGEYYTRAIWEAISRIFKITNDVFIDVFGRGTSTSESSRTRFDGTHIRYN